MIDEQNKEDAVGSNFEPEIELEFRISKLGGATAKGRVEQLDVPAFVLSRVPNSADRPASGRV
jgi:hypothetical protein